MDYEPIKYSARCLKDIFGYCSKGMKGTEQSTPPDKQGKSISFIGTVGKCDENPAECGCYVTNVVANPFRPELVDSKLVTKLEPATGKKEKPAKQEELIK